MSLLARALVFYVMTMVLALLVRMAVPWIGIASLPFTMMTPMIATIIMLAWVAPEGGVKSALTKLGLTTAGLKAWPLAIAAPSLIFAAGLVLLVAAGFTTVQPYAGTRSLLLVLPDLLIGLAIGTAFALGEEVGWRGYMLPRMRQLGLVASMLVVGFLQGLWHMPLLLTTDLYHSTGNPWIVAPLFLVTLTLAGVFYGFLWAWTKSAWPVALAHGAVNSAWNVTERISETQSPMVLEYIGGESGVIMIAGLLLFSIAAVIYMRRHGLDTQSASA